MSMTKRWMEKEREQKTAEEKKTCGCYWNYDDKFEVLCEKHADEEEAENEQGNFFNRNPLQRTCSASGKR